MDLQWWIKYGIDEPLLKEHKVRSLKHILDDRFVVTYTYRRTELGFVYVVYDKVKIYTPHGGDFKWRNTCPSHYLLGAEQLRDKKYLIITKSLKDIMTFKSFLDVDVISPQSESSFIEKHHIDAWKKQYDIVYVVVDYDNAGRKFANKLAEEGFIIRWVDSKEILINKKKIVVDKDISDFTKHHGFAATMVKLHHMFPEMEDNVFLDYRVNELDQLKAKLL
jgi:5S rRNA maturation endonuclease (ribonuclease M5)